MEVILLEKVQNLGDLGDLVNVKPGYARNYLIPHGKATAATAENKARFEQRKRELEQAESERLEQAKHRAELLQGRRFTIARKVTEEGTLFGSVAPADIVELVNAEVESLELEKIEIDLAEGPLKSIGEHEISVALHPEVHLTVPIEVVAEE